MSTQLQDNTSDAKKPMEARDRVILGVMLIAIGLLVFLSQVIDLPQIELLILPGLALIFLIWGLLTREIGLMIPGGILAGVALGVYLMAGPYAGQIEEDQAGVFLLAFSTGWALISLLSLVSKQGFQWWPLIPGAIIGLVGLAIMRGGAAMQLLEIIGYAWPLALVAVGAYLLLRRRG
ncbi:MAG TPA: hypothetical protein VL334_11155 [Anaerolineae bacterium]|nr:hypothetical protein [Anaerolineae bacterium]